MVLKFVRFTTLMAACAMAGSAYAGQKIDYKIDGGSFEGYLSTPKVKGGSKGLVIIIHDWDGLTDYEVKRADMLAMEGYHAFAVDLYGKGNRPVETNMKKAETGKLYNDRELMRKRILAGLDEARKHTKGDAIVMGYCFGGAAVLELARSGKGKNVKGYATFHGGLNTPEGQSYKNGAPIFIAHGGADAGIPMSQVSSLVEELEEAKVNYDLEVYSGAPHGFTVYGSEAYREHADKKSWSSFLQFVEENLGAKA